MVCLRWWWCLCVIGKNMLKTRKKTHKTRKKKKTRKTQKTNKTPTILSPHTNAALRANEETRSTSRNACLKV